MTNYQKHKLLPIAITGIGHLSSFGLHARAIPHILGLGICESSVFEIEGKKYPVVALTSSGRDELNKFVEQNALQKLDPSVQMGVYTAEKAIIAAGWKQQEKERAGVFAGSSRGPTAKIEECIAVLHDSNYSKVPLLSSPLTTAAILPSSIAAFTGCKGPVFQQSVTCSTGSFCIINALAWLQSGMCSHVLAGASDAPLTQFTLTQLKMLGIYTGYDENEFLPCRPLAENYEKSGLILGEAAVMMCLENAEKADNMRIIALIEGFGFGFEAPPSLTGISENGENLQVAMRQALLMSGDIDMIIMHAPGTKKGDMAEWKAIDAVFGENKPFVTSLKWATGHTYGASGPLNIVAAISLLNTSIYPKFPYKTYVNQATPGKPIKRIMINTAGFGGAATSIVISAIQN